MGRVLLKCGFCGKFFATGMNIRSGQDPRKVHKFTCIPYSCTECGEERDYASDDLVDEGASVGSKGRGPQQQQQQPPK